MPPATGPLCNGRRDHRRDHQSPSLVVDRALIDEVLEAAGQSPGNDYSLRICVRMSHTKDERIFTSIYLVARCVRLQDGGTELRIEGERDDCCSAWIARNANGGLEMRMTSCGFEADFMQLAYAAIAAIFGVTHGAEQWSVTKEVKRVSEAEVSTTQWSSRLPVVIGRRVLEVHNAEQTPLALSHEAMPQEHPANVATHVATHTTSGKDARYTTRMSSLSINREWSNVIPPANPSDAPRQWLPVAHHNTLTARIIARDLVLFKRLSLCNLVVAAPSRYDFGAVSPKTAAMERLTAAIHVPNPVLVIEVNPCAGDSATLVNAVLRLNGVQSPPMIRFCVYTTEGKAIHMTVTWSGSEDGVQVSVATHDPCCHATLICASRSVMPFMQFTACPAYRDAMTRCYAMIGTVLGLSSGVEEQWALAHGTNGAEQLGPMKLHFDIAPQDSGRFEVHDVPQGGCIDAGTLRLKFTTQRRPSADLPGNTHMYDMVSQFGAAATQAVDAGMTHEALGPPSAVCPHMVLLRTLAMCVAQRRIFQRAVIRVSADRGNFKPEVTSYGDADMTMVNPVIVIHSVHL